MDEDPISINDPSFAVNCISDTQFPDNPGVLHNNGAGIAFADGHSEIHHWKGSAFLKASKLTTRPSQFTASGTGADKTDLDWLQERSSEPLF
jgi:prepilin-type processing-associated H-X9-DG protein